MSFTIVPSLFAMGAPPSLGMTSPIRSRPIQLEIELAPVGSSTHVRAVASSSEGGALYEAKRLTRYQFRRAFDTLFSDLGASEEARRDAADGVHRSSQ